MPRISGADKRARHFGISHHVIATLQYAALCQAVLPLSEQLSAPLERYIEQLTQTEAFGQHKLVRLHEPSAEASTRGACGVSCSGYVNQKRCVTILIFL